MKSDAPRDRQYVLDVLTLEPELNADEILACRDRYRGGIEPEREPWIRPDRHDATGFDEVTALAALHELRNAFRDRTPHRLDTALDALGEAVRSSGLAAEWSNRLREAAALQPALEALEHDSTVAPAVIDHLRAWLTASPSELDRHTDEAIEDLRSGHEAGSVRQAIARIRTHHAEVARPAGVWLEQVDNRLSSARGRRGPGGPEIPVVVWIYLVLALGLVAIAVHVLVANWRFTVEIPS